MKNVNFRPPVPQRGVPTVNLMRLIKVPPTVPAQKQQEKSLSKEAGSEIAPGDALQKKGAE